MHYKPIQQAVSHIFLPGEVPPKPQRIDILLVGNRILLTQIRLTNPQRLTQCGLLYGGDKKAGISGLTLVI